MSTTTFFWKSKAAMAANILLSAIASSLFCFSLTEFGMLVGAAVASSLCVYPENAFKLTLPVQVVLITLLFWSNMWVAYIAFFIGLPLTLFLYKDADRVTLLVSYFLGMVMSLLGMGVFAGIERLILLL